jgi:pre-mRNA-processing factor 17
VDGTGSYKGPWAEYEGDKPAEEEEEDEEETEEWRAEKRRREDAKAAALEKNKIAREEKSIFHGKQLTDYAGRTYMHIPTDVDAKLNPADGTPAPNAYIPERCVHTWTGHNKGVSAIRLFPKSGHLLLSGSMDTKIKVSLSCRDRDTRVLTFAALGCLPRGQLFAYVHGPLAGRQGRRVQPARFQLPLVVV